MEKCHTSAKKAKVNSRNKVVQYRNQTIFAVARLDLEHCTNAKSRDTGSFISVVIERTSSAKGRENLRRGAEEDVKRLGTTRNNQMQASSLSVRQDLGQHIVTKDQPREGESNGPKEDLTPGKGKSMDHMHENAPAASPDNTNASHASRANFAAPGLTVPLKLVNLANTVSQNVDVLVSLGTVPDKIQRIPDVTANAVDALAKASDPAEHV